MSLMQRPYRHPSHLKKPITETRALKHPAAPTNSYANHQALLARADALDAAGNHAEADDHRAQAAKVLRDAKIAAMEAEGRFHILDKPLAVKDRNRIRAMDTAQVSRLINQLRDHLDVETLVVNLDPTNLEDVRRAQRIAAFLGDVSMTWVEGQTRKHDKQAAALIDSYDREMSAALARRDNAAAKALRDKYRADFDRMAWQLGEARISAVTELLHHTVGTDKPIRNVTLHLTTPTSVQDHFDRTSPMIPNSLKSGIERNCKQVHVFMTDDACYYDDADVCDVVYAVPSVDARVQKSIDTQAGPVTSKCAVSIPGTGKTVFVTLGGAVGRAADEQQVNAAVKALNKAAKSGGSSLQFQRGITESGHLTVVPYYSTRQTTTVNGNVLRVTNDHKSVLHEFGHRVEHGNTYITHLERTTIKTRASGENPALTGKNYEAFKDDFANYYSGTIWIDGKAELFTTGLEALCGYRNGAGVGLGMWSSGMDQTVSMTDQRLIEDRELVSMTLGILTTAKREK